MAREFTSALAGPGPIRIRVPAGTIAARRREDGRLTAGLWLADVDRAMRRGVPLEVLARAEALREQVHPGRTLCRARARQIRRQLHAGRRP